jgi:hypothetical protein
MKVVTYANKSNGLFDDLINNKHRVHVEVIGWGTKWNGFQDKTKGVLDYLKTQPDDEIVIYVDGFDSIIKDNLSTVKQKFDEYDCKVLFSKEPLDSGTEIMLIKQIMYFCKKIVFQNCIKKNIANAGMFMGYAKHLKIVLNDILKNKCNDDQVIVNKLCKKYDFIKVDIHNKIFKNYFNVSLEKQHLKEFLQNDAIFVSFPGTLSWDRMLRVFPEYLQFFYKYIVIFHLILIAIFFKKHLYFSTSLLIISLYYFIFCDRSCV